MGTKKKYHDRPVKYISDWTVSLDDLRQPVYMATYSHEMVRMSHTKRYHNCLYVLAGLASCARDLMDYITEKMDDNNTIATNQYFRQRFISFIYDSTGGNVKYCDSSVKRALRDLTGKKLIRPIQRGASQVNPLYFWKNDDSERERAIRLDLEFISGQAAKLRVLQEANGDGKELK